MFKAWFEKINWPVNVDNIEYVKNKLTDMQYEQYHDFIVRSHEAVLKRKDELDRSLLEIYKNSDEQKGS